jgi:hypothetical protein
MFYGGLTGFGGGVPAVATYRYLRVKWTAVNGSAETRIDEINWRDASSAAIPSAAMTSNSAPSPLVATASAGTNQFRAYNNLTGNTLIYNGPVTAGDLTIDLGAGNGIAPIQCDLYSSWHSAHLTSMIKDFTLRGSNDAFASEDVVLKTLTGETGWGITETRNYTIP